MCVWSCQKQSTGYNRHRHLHLPNMEKMRMRGAGLAELRLGGRPQLLLLPAWKSRCKDTSQPLWLFWDMMVVMLEHLGHVFIRSSPWECPCLDWGEAGISSSDSSIHQGVLRPQGSYEKSLSVTGKVSREAPFAHAHRCQVSGHDIHHTP